MYGNKAKNLQILQALGLRVPEFYEINSDTLKKLHSPRVAMQAVNAFNKWCKENKCDVVAVRSSAEGEDTIEQSFAGQFTSVMMVRGSEQLLEALYRVSDSKPAAGYANNKNIKVHVIVQKYIEPEVAGVLFTVNPSNGLPEMLINVARGHGSNVVEGKEVSTIHIDRLTDDIRANKDGNKLSLLSTDQIIELKELGEIIESQMKSPQDIEWAYSNDDLYVLQTRPITRIAHLRVWDSSNIGESFPGIVMPLTFSIARRGYELVYKSQGYEAGLNWYQLEENHRIFNAMVGIFAGRMYYNLQNWYKFIGLFPNNSQNQKYLDQQIQTVGDAAYLPPSNYPLSYKIQFFLRIIRRALFFEWEKKRYWNDLESTYEKFNKLPLGDDVFILLDRYAFIEQKVIPQIGRSADNDFFVMTYHGILKSKLKRWLGDNNSQTLDFLGSLHDIISARQATLLTEIANAIKEDPVALKYITTNNFEALDRHLLSTKAAALINEYRSKFLHRFAEDQKIEAKNPLLTLSGFYSLIKIYLQLDRETLVKRSKEALIADQNRNKKIIKQLGPTRKIIYRTLLWRLKHHLRIREHNRLLRGKAYAFLRENFIQLGKSLSNKGLIEQPDDIYYLDIEELFSLTNGTGYNDDVRKIITIRKNQYEQYRKMKIPARFITTGLTNILPKDPPNTMSKDSVNTTSFKGTISSPGNIEGKVIVLDKPLIPKEPFDILVVSHTDPGWTPLIALAKGLIVEHGGILSHAAIVTRELGIPSIIGVENITQKLKNGMHVRINSAKGTVDIIKS